MLQQYCLLYYINGHHCRKSITEPILMHMLIDQRYKDLFGTVGTLDSQKIIYIVLKLETDQIDFLYK